MIIVVDGYNVLKQIMPAHMVTEEERVAFITMLAIYHKYKNHKIIIVFDGGPYSRPVKDEIRHITVVYTGMHESADDYIIQYGKIHQSSKLLLVSSDRALIKSMKEFNILSVTAQFFYERVYTTVKNKQMLSKSTTDVRVVKLTEQDNPTLDTLMYEASKKEVPIKPDDAKREIHVPASSKESKEERKLKQLIDKL